MFKVIIIREKYYLICIKSQINWLRKFILNRKMNARCMNIKIMKFFYQMYLLYRDKIIR